MKKIKYFMITGMLLASIGLAGCGKKSEDDITNKEIYQDDLEPLTEEELNEMDADTSDEDMKQIDEPEEETADITDTTDATETTDKTENTEENVPSTIMDNINKEIENATDEVKANVIDNTTITIVNIGSGIVIFLAVRVILVIISLFAKILTDLPVIKQVDKLGGLAYGAIEGIVIVYAVLAVISLTSVIWANNAVVTAIAKSSLGEMLYNNNIILNLLFK